MNKASPILSICIPTFNRRFQLESLVNSIISQAEFISGEVELSISDNASTDSTKEYLETFGHDQQLILNYNKQNLGYMANFKKAIEQSSGEYVWLVGSDDLIAPAALKGLIETIKSNTDCDYFMVNNLFWYSGESILNSYTFDDIPDKQARSDDFSSHRVNEVKELVVKRTDAFTPMYSSIMRRFHWLNSFTIVEPDKHTFETINNCSFFAVYIATNLFNKSGFYYGNPPILASHTIGWEDYRAIFTVCRLADLYDLWIKNGTDKNLVKTYKRYYYGPNYKIMVIQLLKKQVSGSQYFSFATFFKQNIGTYSVHDFMEIFFALIIDPTTNYKEKFRIYLSRIKRVLVTLTK
jgi:glycosyltransferase involved in cell wall biosynthesis